MKKLITILCAAAALLTGLWGCQQKEQAEPVKGIELRYRVADSYELPATGAAPFTIVVVGAEPWTITSAHPEWSIISEEEGEAQDWDLVHTGKGNPTNVTVQYYDNTSLEAREDELVIACEKWVAKKVKVVQLGCAFLTIPEDALAFLVEKAGGSFEIPVKTNQNWTAAITGGDWITIEQGASGNGSGTIVVNAAENAGEMRYAQITVYDRHGEESAQINFTQDGVQLDPEAFEIRASFDQTSAELGVTSNTRWQVKKTADDNWFEIVNGSGNGDGKITLSLTKNESDGLRTASILLTSVSDKADDFVAEKEIVIKQANELQPVRVMMKADEVDLWTSDWANKPSYVKDVGVLFTAQARLNRSMPFGTYTFCWSNLTVDPNSADGIRVRHWFCFSEGCELKADIRPVDGKVSYDFNTAGDGNKPSIDGFTDLDFTQPVEVTYKFDPSGAEHCHVTYLVNGKEAGSFDTSSEMLRTVTWGAGINMYIGVDKSGSAVCEWYEYTAPVDWGD